MNWAILLGCAALIAVLRAKAMRIRYKIVQIIAWAVILLLTMAAGWAFFQTDLGRWLMDGLAGLVGLVGLAPAVVATFAAIIALIIVVADIVDSRDGNPAALGATFILPGLILLVGGPIAASVTQVWSGGYNVVVSFIGSV